MLRLRPHCECCDTDLPPDAANARICSNERTFCADCCDHRLAGICPNCGGELQPRPRRPAAALRPTAHIHVASKAPWWTLTGQLAQHAGFEPDRT